MWPFRDKPEPEEAPEAPQANQPAGFFTTDGDASLPIESPDQTRARVERQAFQIRSYATKNGEAVAMDSAETGGFEAAFSLANGGGVSQMLLSWYGAQSFIGFQTCGIIAQHWLVEKACNMPARDAIRTGYDITANDGGELPPEVVSAFRQADKRMNITRQMRQFIGMGRTFGIRHALFKIDGIDYSLPFNPDGIKPGSYRGIVQIDPYWVTPYLNHANTSEPGSLNFYEPDFWNVGGQQIHKSHFIIYRPVEVMDALKPTYQYGTVSIPQKIYERVYAAERTANEAPQLAMTKRTTVLGVDMEKAVAKWSQFVQRLQEWAFLRDNYGIKTRGTAETVEQFDTSLADLDAVIMTQYQLVAAIAEVPATKLLGTSPKGFGASGEYEITSYHEFLESIQTNDLQPLIERHHLCVARSYVEPKFPELGRITTDVVWRPLDTPTAKEWAEINEIKARTGVSLVQSGAIDGIDERARITADPDSGYTGLPEPEPELTEEITRGEDPTTADE